MGRDENGKIKQEVVDYIENTQLAVLSTVRDDGTPVPRTMGAFALDDGGRTVYFATVPDAEKTRHIKGNQRVSFLFQHEGQPFPEFRNVVIIGNAALATDEAERGRAIELITARSPFVKERIDNEGAGVFGFYRINATEIKFLDFSKGIGPASVETVFL